MTVSRRLVLFLLLLVVAAVLLFLPLPVPPTTAGRTIENAGHTPLFMALTLGFLAVLSRDFNLTGAKVYVISAILGLGGGIATEIIQIPFHRDASWEDVADDALGVVLALALYALFDGRTRMGRFMRFVALCVVVACATIYVTPILRMERAYLHRDGQFPVLADFASSTELYWVVGYGVNRSLVRGALDIEFTPAEFPGVSFYEPVPDWHGFRTLVIDLENPDADALKISIRVHDIGHGRDYADRFNRRYTLAAQERRTIRIALEEIRRAPRGRVMDLRQISDITIFRGEPSGSRHLRVYSVRLE